jgi:hypothetical protein
MTTSAVTPAIVTLEEAQDYLRDSGVRDASNDTVMRILNGVHGDFCEITARKRVIDDDTTITEYRDGDGSQTIFTLEYPITALTTVTLYPHESTLTETYSGPGTSLSNDDMIVDQIAGKIKLKDDIFPSDFQSVQLDYKAGHSSTSSEAAAIKLVLLEMLQTRWARFLEKPSIISTREQNEHRWTFKKDKEIRDATLRLCSPWRRLHW